MSTTLGGGGAKLGIIFVASTIMLLSFFGIPAIVYRGMEANIEYTVIVHGVSDQGDSYIFDTEISFKNLNNFKIAWRNIDVSVYSSKSKSVLYATLTPADGEIGAGLTASFRQDVQVSKSATSPVYVIITGQFTWNGNIYPANYEQEVVIPLI